jgi:UV DNA damage repair endonuclease
MSTWPDDIIPTVHYSESHELHVGNEKPTPKHSILVNSIPPTYGHCIDIMVEAKGKELAILPHMER